MENPSGTHTRLSPTSEVIPLLMINGAVKQTEIYSTLDGAIRFVRAWMY